MPSQLLKINNENDQEAAAQIASVQNGRSIPEIVAAYVTTRSHDNEDFECTIAKTLLPFSYNGNPSALALKIFQKLPQEDWRDCAGFQTPNKNTHITIKIFRERKTGRRHNPFPSVKALVRNWLALNLQKSKKLSIPIATIPPFFFSHPEQLCYQVKCETQTPIKITKLKSSWLISRK